MKPTITSNSHLKHYVVCHRIQQIFLLTQLLLRSVVVAVIICKIFYMESFFSLNSYSMEKLLPKSFSPSVHQFLRVHYNFFIPSVMIGVLHATVIEVPHLHKTACSSYTNAKIGMTTSTRTKLPETMHTVLSQLPQSV